MNVNDLATLILATAPIGTKLSVRVVQPHELDRKFRESDTRKTVFSVAIHYPDHGGYRASTDEYNQTTDLHDTLKLALSDVSNLFACQ